MLSTLVFRVGAHYGRYKRDSAYSTFIWHNMEKPNG